MSPWDRLMNFFSPRDRRPSYQVSPTEGHQAAQEARRDAESVLLQVRSQAPEVARVAESLATLRANNHFGQSVEQALLPRRK